MLLLLETKKAKLKLSGLGNKGLKVLAKTPLVPEIKREGNHTTQDTTPKILTLIL